MDTNTPRKHEQSTELDPNFGTVPTADKVDADKILDLLAVEEDQIKELETQHFFAQNQYLRIAYMPAGAMIVGKKHKQPTLNVLLTGEVLIYTKENVEPLVLTAPHIFESAAMVRKVVVTKTAASFVNIHVTSNRDLKALEEELIEPETEEMMQADIQEIFKSMETN